MKFKTRLLIALLMCGAALTYTACKKAASNSNGPTLSPQQVSSQVALNLAQSLYNGFGGLDLNNGITGGLSAYVPTNKHIKLGDINDPFCGFGIDTTINITSNDDGVQAAVSGHIAFAFTCTNGVLSGYTTNDNLNVSESTTDFSVKLNLTENVSVVALTPSNDESKFSINGTVNSDASYDYKTGSKGSGTALFDYNFKQVIVDPSADADIISGSADFTTKGTGSNGVWNYTGTVTFLGGHKAKITINGANYTVDLTTGAVSLHKSLGTQLSK